MRRWIFNIWCVIWLILFLGTAGTWVTSQFWRDQLAYTSSGSGGMSLTAHAFGWDQGGFYCGREFMQASQGVLAPGIGTGWTLHTWAAPSRGQSASRFNVSLKPDLFYFLGFGHQSSRGTFTHGSGPVYGEYWEIRVPHWFVMLLLALAPARWVILKRRKIRLPAPNLCKTCGYDLRATPDEKGPLLPRCPECGKQSAASPAAR